MQYYFILFFFCFNDGQALRGVLLRSAPLPTAAAAATDKKHNHAGVFFCFFAATIQRATRTQATQLSPSAALLFFSDFSIMLYNRRCILLLTIVFDTTRHDTTRHFFFRCR